MSEPDSADHHRARASRERRLASAVADPEADAIREELASGYADPAARADGSVEVRPPWASGG